MRHPLILAALISALAIPAAPALAQYGGQGGPGGGGPGGGRGSPGGASGGDDAAAKAKKDAEWNTTQRLDLPGKKNAGPCPYVKVLWDAARYVELKDNREAFDAVGYTGEIQNLSSGCSYTGAEPIKVAMELLFAFGRGPQALGSSKDYTYWVAVTDKDYGVLDKQYFTVHANFPGGTDRIMMTDHIDGIVIPRANANVAGGNFEVLVGFEVTPEMAAFNQAGKRFKVNSGTARAQAAQAQPAPQ
jgi:hypothetical protein